MRCCFFFFHRPNGRKVVLGVHSLSQPEETKQTFDILELHNHPEFSHINYDNDIALIKVRVYFVYVCYVGAALNNRSLRSRNGVK